MAKVKFDDGTVINFEGNPSPQDIEEAYNQVKGSSQNNQASQTIQERPAEDFGSQIMSESQSLSMPTAKPGDFLDRLYLSAFADEKGKEDYLRNKFGYATRGEDGVLYFGSSAKDLRPFDPEGISGDILGEVADMLSQAPQIGASILGGTLGLASAGPGGAIAGAMAGGAGAEATMKLAGKSLGLNTQDPTEVGVDVLISGIGSGAGEGLGQFLKAANSRQVAKKSFQLLQQQVNNMPLTQDKSKFVGFLSKLFNVTSGVPETKTQNVFRLGADKVFEKGAGSPQALLRLVDDFGKFANDMDKSLSSVIGKDEEFLLEKAAKTDIPTVELQKSVLKVMRELGLIDNYGNVGKPIRGSGVGSQSSTLIDVFERLNKAAKEVSPGRPTFMGSKIVSQEKVPVLTVNPEAKIKAGELLSLRNQLRTAKESSNNSTFQSLVNDILSGNPQKGLAGFSDEVEKIASKVGLNKYSANRLALRDFRSSLEALKKAGLDPKNSALSIENITKGANEMAETLRREMMKLDKVYNQKFLDRMDIWDTAQAFTSTNPNFLRFNTVASVLGGGALIAGRSPEEKAAGLGGAMLLGTPAGAKLILKNLSRFKGLNKVVTTQAIKSASKGTLAQRALLQTLSNLSTKKFGDNSNKDYRKNKV